MSETVQMDGSIYLCGRKVEMGEVLDEYFNRGYMLVPASSCADQADGKSTSFCSVYLPEDFRERLAARDEWQNGLSNREAARQRLLYERKKRAA